MRKDDEVLEGRIVQKFVRDTTLLETFLEWHSECSASKAPSPPFFEMDLYQLVHSQTR